MWRTLQFCTLVKLIQQLLKACLRLTIALTGGRVTADPFSAPEQEIGGGTDTAVARAATITVAIVGVGGSAVAGTAYALYKEVHSLHAVPYVVS